MQYDAASAVARPLRLVLLAGLCASGIVAAGLAQQKLDEAVADLRMALDACTADHGYDPDDADGLGANELHPGERAWADCAYRAVDAEMKARSRIPEAYDRLIAKHRELTDKVEAGSITRAQRKAQVQTMLTSIRNQEEALQETERKSASEINDTVEQQRTLQRLQRQERAVHRSLRSMQRAF